MRRGMKGDAVLTMHRSLKVPPEESSEYPSEQASLYIVDQALAAAQLRQDPKVLDAGCGYGGTMFRWHGKVGGSYDGCTLSKVQWRIAQREARRRNLSSKCHFHLQSYDEAIGSGSGSSYDAIISIESMIHSPNLKQTLAHLASMLGPEGKLVLVEDMATDDANLAEDPDRVRLQKHWQLATLPSLEFYERCFAELGLVKIHDSDFSNGFQTRDSAWIESQRRKYRTAYRAIPLAGPRFIISAFLGGLALEELYNKGLMRYRLLVVSKAV